MKLTAPEFEKLALDQIDTLNRVAGRMTRDPERGADLVQETYLRAFRARDSFDLQQYGIRPWLLRIMHNLHVSRGERERRQPAAVDGETLDGIDGSYAPDPPHWDTLDPDDLDQNLAKALEGLQTEYQLVLLLWAVEGLSYKEIAASLDIPIGTVMSRLHRARQRLSTELRDYALKERLIRE
jgi:RNA polymerase sigma-70 factor (ECF subfamily)